MCLVQGPQRSCLRKNVFGTHSCNTLMAHCPLQQCPLWSKNIHPRGTSRHNVRPHHLYHPDSLVACESLVVLQRVVVPQPSVHCIHVSAGQLQIKIIINEEAGSMCVCF